MREEDKDGGQDGEEKGGGVGRKKGRGDYDDAEDVGRRGMRKVSGKRLEKKTGPEEQNVNRNDGKGIGE